MRSSMLVLVAVSLVSPRAANALCIAPHQQPAIVNDGVAAPPDGGLLVATATDHRKPDEGEAAQPAWRLRDGTKVSKPAIVTLAPGLVVYRLPAGMVAAELHDGTIARATFSSMSAADAAKLAPLAAPAATRIATTTVSGTRGSSTTTIVSLTAPAPANALALVLYDAKTKRPLSYGLVVAGATEVNVHAQGRCSALPNGTSIARPKTRAFVRWVDAHGRLSAPTKAIVVAKGP
jgi:hypothetical protein